jgi:hypothetical protein
MNLLLDTTAFMEYLGEIELENNYKHICKVFSEEDGNNGNCNGGEDVNFIEDFEINEKTIWFICYKKNITLLKKIYTRNPKLAKLVFEVVKEKNMKELINWCESQ